MNVQPLYQHYNRNVGKIIQINGDILKVNVNAGHGGGEMDIHIAACDVPGASKYKFKPEVGDRVLVCVDEDGEYPGLILEKLQKTRVGKA